MADILVNNIAPYQKMLGKVLRLWMLVKLKGVSPPYKIDGLSPV